jgi:hypothetical protein
VTKDGRRDYGTVGPKVARLLGRGLSTKAAAKEIGTTPVNVRIAAYRQGFKYQDGKWCRGVTTNG